MAVLADGHRGPFEKGGTLELVALEGVFVGDGGTQSRQVFRARIDQVDVRNETLVQRGFDVQVTQPERRYDTRECNAERQQNGAQQARHD